MPPDKERAPGEGRSSIDPPPSSSTRPKGSGVFRDPATTEGRYWLWTTLLIIHCLVNGDDLTARVADKRRREQWPSPPCPPGCDLCELERSAAA